MEASDPQQPSSTSSQKPDEAPESKIDAPEEQNAFGAYKVRRLSTVAVSSRSLLANIVHPCE